MTQSIRFGDWVWDPNTLELRNGSRITTLEPRTAQLLEYLVTHPGELLSHDRLIEAVWDGRVVSDETVRRTVFNLRQALAVEGAESYIRTIHKKGYVAAFPETIAANQQVAPAAIDPVSGETPPDTPANESVGVSSTRNSTPLRGLKLLAIACAVSLVAVVLTRVDLSWERAADSTPTAVPENAPATIAVLPFTDLAGDADSEFLADGLAEELMGTLSRNPALRVTARSSAFQFEGANLDLHDVGQRLGVRYVLDGNVRRVGERMRIHARLVDTGSGAQLWGQVYTHPLADWFALEQDISAEIARALHVVLPRGGETVAHTADSYNVEAHMEVLRARELLASRSVAGAEQAVEHLQRALTLDPDYALANARLADAILIQAQSTTGIQAARPVVASLLDKALALDPGLGEAYALRSLLSDDPAAAERDLRRGLELNPSYARGYELLAALQFTSLKQFELALRTIDNAIALDPLTPGNYHAKAEILMAAGDWAGAAALDRRALELNPNFGAALVQLGWIASLEGRQCRCARRW